MRKITLSAYIRVLACVLATMAATKSVCAKFSASSGARTRIPFVENTGWMESGNKIRFVAHTFAGAVCVEEDGGIAYFPYRAAGAAAASGTPCFLVERLDSPVHPEICGVAPADTKINLFVGDNPLRWQKDVPAYNALLMTQPASGLSLQLRAYGGNVEKILVLMPGADPADIRMRLDGAENIALDDSGNLLVRGGGTEIVFTAPLAYQIGVFGIEPVPVRYQVCANGYGFTLGDFDHNRPLIIDPLLGGTYLGGYQWDSAQAMAVAADGSIYVAGSTASLDFPVTSGAYQTNRHGAFVSRFNAQLSELLASTYLGGSDNEAAYALALDAAGRVCVAGATTSSNFPTTAGAYQRVIGSVETQDVFVAVLSADLDSLIFSTLLGGIGMDWAEAICVDSHGNICVGGRTASTNFPTTVGAFQRELLGWGDGFVAKLSPDLSQLRAATYLGGSAYEQINALSITWDDLVYVAGETSSTNFPATNLPYAAALSGEMDGFIAKFDGGLSNLLNATYFGGVGTDTVVNLTIASDSSVFIGGYTYSTNFPTTLGAFQSELAFPTGGCHGFISCFNAALREVAASTLLGGADNSSFLQDLQLDADGRVWVVGYTFASNFPVTAHAYSTILRGGEFGESDAFVASLDGTLAAMVACTYLGGQRADYGHALAFDADGNILVAGYTESPDFPTAPDGYERQYHTPVNFWHGDAFIAKLDPTLGDFPAPPANVVATDRVYPDRVRVTWTASDGANGYTIWRGLSSVGDDRALIGATTAVEFFDFNTVPGQLYYYWIKATNAGGVSAYSISASGMRSAVIPVGADFDGDGRADPAAVTNGAWYAWLSGSGYALRGPAFAEAVDRLFAAGDFDADGRADPCAVSAAGAWKVWQSASGYQPAVYRNVLTNGLPIAADFDGDRLADAAVYAGDTWYFRLSGQQYVLAEFYVGAYPNAMAFGADFDGDGRADPALFNPDDGVWIIWRSGSWYAPYVSPEGFAETGSIPAAADFDGDGYADVAAFKLASGRWYFWLSSRSYAKFGPWL